MFGKEITLLYMSIYDLGYTLGYLSGIGLLVLMALIAVLVVKGPRITFVSGRRRKRRGRTSTSYKDEGKSNHDPR